MIRNLTLMKLNSIRVFESRVFCNSVNICITKFYTDIIKQLSNLT